MRDIENILVKDVRLGEGSILSSMTKTEDRVKVQDVRLNADVYVSSVRKENGKINFCVSNDTNRPHKLVIVTDKGVNEFDVPAFPKASVTNENVKH